MNTPINFDLIRYNSLRSQADITLDYDFNDYLKAGVDIFPAGAKFLPPYNLSINPLRIFIKSDFLTTSIEYLKSLKCNFHLLTGSSDILACPSIEFAESLKNDTKICSWVGNNLQEFFPWMLCVPIGFEERGRKQRQPENIFNPILKNEKDIDIYVPYFSKTNADRVLTIEKIKKLKSKRIFVELNKISYHDYCNKLARSNYVICLEGNGIDTIRIYETIVHNSIPVLLQSKIWNMHREIGAVILEDFNDCIYLPEAPLLKPNLYMLSTNYQYQKIFNHQMQFFLKST
jgi:hypothetical protein